MTEHAIKIKEVYFKAVLSGEKTFEIRKNDRDYQVGDIIHFVPVDDECGMIIPHDPNTYKITYIFHGGEYGLEEGYCVFGITPEAHDRGIREKVIDEFVRNTETKIREKILKYQEALDFIGGLAVANTIIDEVADQMKGGGKYAESN